MRLAYLSRGSSKLLAMHQGRAHRLAIEPGSPNRFMTCGEIRERGEGGVTPWEGSIQRWSGLLAGEGEVGG